MNWLLYKSELDGVDCQTVSRVYLFVWWLVCLFIYLLLFKHGNPSNKLLFKGFVIK